MSTLQLVAVVVGLVLSLGGTAFAVGRVVFVVEDRVARSIDDIKSVAMRIKEVEGKVDGVDREVTGPHSSRAVKLAGDIANVEHKVDRVIADLGTFISEYRADQKHRRP